MKKLTTLSKQAKAIWGKLSHDGSHTWLPLWIHLADTAEIFSYLWHHWVPNHTKTIIINGLEINDGQPKVSNEDDAEKLLRLLAASHDIGKASPGFAVKANQVGFSDVVDRITALGLPIKIKASGKVKNIPHAHISEYILENYGLERSASIIVGAHHGSPPNTAHEIEIVNEYNRLTGVNESAWHEMQVELVKYAISISGFDTMPTVKVSVPAQIIMNGLIIMADWLASDENRFSLISWDYSTYENISSKERAKDAWYLIPARAGVIPGTNRPGVCLCPNPRASGGDPLKAYLKKDKQD